MSFILNTDKRKKCEKEESFVKNKTGKELQTSTPGVNSFLKLIGSILRMLVLVAVVVI